VLTDLQAEYKWKIKHPVKVIYTMHFDLSKVLCRHDQKRTSLQETTGMKKQIADEKDGKMEGGLCNYSV